MALEIVRTVDLRVIDLRVFQKLGGLLATKYHMIMRGHQTIYRHFRQWNDIFLDVTQEVQVIFRLKENTLAVISAIVDVIVQTWSKGRLSAGHW